MWPSLITRTYFPFNIITIFAATRLKGPNETLSPIISSDACLMRDYYFKGIYASFIRKSAHIKGSLLSAHADYNICSIYRVSPFRVYKMHRYTLGWRIQGSLIYKKPFVGIFSGFTIPII